MKKRFFINGILLAVVVVLCVFFAVQPSFFQQEQLQRMSDMSKEDIRLSVIDEQTVRLENLIKGNDLAYSWIIENTINGVSVYSNADSDSDGDLEEEELLAFAENDVIEISYQTLESLSFQAIIEHEGVRYTSNTFFVASDGSLIESILSNASITNIDNSTARGVDDIVSLAYLLFLLFFVLLYFLVPQKKQWVVLLLASLLFYVLSGVQYIVFILFSSAIAFFVAKNMSSKHRALNEVLEQITNLKEKKQHKTQLQRENRQLLFTALIATLGVMVVIKYTSFATENLNEIFSLGLPMLSLVMPLGLSFYTFILVAYLVDVYRGKYAAEEQYLKLLLFVSFFPHVTQGPISRYNDLSNQLQKGHSFCYHNFCKAAQRILWGFFIKLVLADRLGLLVSGVYDAYESQSWLMLTIATLCYSIQIYADFYSSMEIAIGSAQMFGIQLSENFMRPYFSTSMPEFWRRWHITLGTWFRDYVFYPISMSGVLMKFNVWTRKKFGVHLSRVLAAAPPVLGVWVLTGLWHGAAWNFVAWGLFHGCLILLSTAFSQQIQSGLEKRGVPLEAWYYKLFQMGRVFLLCTVGRVFFRASSVSEAFDIFGKIVGLSAPNGLLNGTDIPFGRTDFVLALLGVLALLTVSIIQERKGSVREEIAKQNIVVRWSIWILLILITVLFGIYGPGTAPVFLYEAF